MEIKIELEAVEHLKQEILRLSKENAELKIKLKSLDSTLLSNQACELSVKILNNILSRVFSELGFENITDPFSINIGELNHYLGKTWFYSDKLDIELNVLVTQNFRKAFLKMGIKSDNEN